MAYARFGNTDIYLYEAAEGFTCCGCKLDGHWVGPNREAVLKHLDRHIKVGHYISDAREVIKEEMDSIAIGYAYTYDSTLFFSNCVDLLKVYDEEGKLGKLHILLNGQEAIELTLEDIEELRK